MVDSTQHMVDSVASGVGDGVVDGFVSMAQEVSPAFFYGQSSYSVILEGVEGCVFSGSGIGFDLGLLLLLLFGVYVVFLSLFFREIRVCIKSFLSVSDSLMFYENTTVGFTRFRFFSKYFFLFLFSVSFYVFVLDAFSVERFSGLSFWCLFGILSVLCYGVCLLSSGFMALIGLFDYVPSRWLVILRVTDFDRTFSVVFLPLFLVLYGLFSFVWLLFFCMIVCFYFYHILRLLYIFRVNRFSFLQSILYLCAVEIAPLALLLGMVSRTKLL